MMSVEQKLKRKLEREEAKAERLAELSQKLKVGAFLIRVSGVTMRRVKFFEVISIEKSKVYLREAHVKAEGDVCQGYKTLLGAGQGEATEVAKIRSGVIALGSHFWDHLKFAEVGQREVEYSD